MKGEILLIVARTNAPQMEPMLATAFTVHKLPQAHMNDPAAHVAPFADRIRAVVTQTVPGATAALIAALPNLEAIVCSGAHVDAIDLDAARARGIVVTNTPGLSTNDLGDFVMGQILVASRRFVEADRFARAGGWPDGSLPFGRRVNGKKLGIVGLGPIGRTVARRAGGFDMDICYTGPNRKPDVPYRYFDDLIAMARTVDIMAVTCRSGPETRHMIGQAVFEALGPDAIFVNVTRGVVDEAALIQALRDGTLRGAATDVHENSPHINKGLLALDNVILTPHIAGPGCEELCQVQSAQVIANLDAHFAGQPPPNPVTADAH